MTGHIAVGRALAIDAALGPHRGRTPSFHPVAGHVAMIAAGSVTTSGPGAERRAVLGARHRAARIGLRTPEGAVSSCLTADVVAGDADRAKTHPFVGRVLTGLRAGAAEGRPPHRSQQQRSQCRHPTRSACPNRGSRLHRLPKYTQVAHDAIYLTLARKRPASYALPCYSRSVLGYPIEPTPPKRVALIGAGGAKPTVKSTPCRGRS